MKFKTWMEASDEIIIYHAKTKDDFDKPSVDIGSDADIMGRGLVTVAAESLEN